MHTPRHSLTKAATLVFSAWLLSGVSARPASEARDVGDFTLRIMPLGASATEGTRSTDGNGYRNYVYTALQSEGWTVDMVGSRRTGNMADPDHEGTGGYVITQINDKFDTVSYMQPNLVLLNAGTNDCTQNIDIANAGTRLKNLIDDIYEAISGVTVVVTTLSISATKNECASTVSQQYRELVEDYKTAGARIELGDWNAAMTAEMLDSDGVHPNDVGYKAFADVYLEAIAKVEGVLQPPNDV